MVTWSWVITWSLKNGVERQRPWFFKRRIWFLWSPAKIVRDNRILYSEKNTAPLFNYPQPRKTKTNILVFKTTLVIVHLIITRKDTFYLRNTADIGTITAIVIKRDESGWFPKWQLERVSSWTLYVKVLTLFKIAILFVCARYERKQENQCLKLWCGTWGAWEQAPSLIRGREKISCAAGHSPVVYICQWYQHF